MRSESRRRREAWSNKRAPASRARSRTDSLRAKLMVKVKLQGFVINVHRLLIGINFGFA